jgi:hypothetical protein
MTSCIPTKSNLYLDSSVKTVIREPALYNPYIPQSNPHIYILSLRLFIQRIHPSQRLIYIFYNRLIFYGKRLLAPCSTPKLEDHQFSFVHGCLFSIFTVTLDSWRPSPHLQPKDVPCCGDKDPPNMGTYFMCFHFLWCTQLDCITINMLSLQSKQNKYENVVHY